MATVTYLIESYSDQPELMIRNADDGEIVGRVDCEERVSATSNSHDLVALCADQLIGPVVSVEHDNDVIHVTCSVPEPIESLE